MVYYCLLGTSFMICHGLVLSPVTCLVPCHMSCALSHVLSCFLSCPIPCPAPFSALSSNVLPLHAPVLSLSRLVMSPSPVLCPVR